MTMRPKLTQEKNYAMAATTLHVVMVGTIGMITGEK